LIEGAVGHHIIIIIIIITIIIGYPRRAPTCRVRSIDRF
jgi:hypothetical protein